MRRMAVYLLIGLALLIVASLVLAQAGEFDVPWHRAAGGGGTSTDGSQYSLSGTIGQAEAGVSMSGASFELSGGFWGGAGDGPKAHQLYLPVVLRPN